MPMTHILTPAGRWNYYFDLYNDCTEIQGNLIIDFVDKDASREKEPHEICNSGPNPQTKCQKGQTCQDCLTESLRKIETVDGYRK